MKKTTFLALAIILVLAAGYTYAVEVTLLGPKQYARTEGNPNIYTETFPGRLGNGMIVIQNGGVDGIDLVSGAIIKVNGVEIFGVSDFNQSVLRLEKSIVNNEINSLTIELRSKPGSFLLVQIVQVIEAEAAEVVGPQGGEIKVENPDSPLFGYAILIPPGALTTSAIIGVGYAPDLQISYNPQKEESLCLPAFELTPNLLTLREPAKISIPIPDANGDKIADGSNLPLLCGQLYYIDQDGNTLVRVEAEIDEGASAIIAQIKHFSFWVPWLNRWQRNTTVYYDLEEYPVPITNHGWDSIVQEIQFAFDKWSSAVDGTIKFVRSGEWDLPDFQIKFKADYPEDYQFGVVHRQLMPWPIVYGQPWEVLFPVNYESKFYYWVTEDYWPYEEFTSIPFTDKFAALRCFMHEFGHTMYLPDYPGLNSNPPHSGPYSIMKYDDTEDPLVFPYTELSEFDIKQVRELYGLPDIGQNLIPNPSFEEFDPQGMLAPFYWVGNDVILEYLGHTGLMAATFFHPGAFWSTEIEVPIAGTYKLSIWVMSDSAPGALCWGGTNPWVELPYSYSWSQAPHQWTLVESEFTLSAGKQPFSIQWPYHSIGGFGQLWIDDVSLTRVR